MNTKTMEGLVGAGTNISIANTPMRVFREASRKGDTAAMERAMGYVNEFQSKAEQYKTEANEGMKEDAKEERQKAKLEMEKAIEKRRKEREQLEERIEGSSKDNVEISEDGKVLLKENADGDGSTVTTETKADFTDIAKEPVAYTQTGEVINLAEQKTNISVSL